MMLINTNERSKQLNQEFKKSPSGLCVELHSPDSKQRQSLEHFISNIFEHYYQTKITTFYPQLLAVTTQKTQLAAVAGIRNGEQHALFSEHYLESPITDYTRIKLLSNSEPQNYQRKHIVEVGNMAPANIGQMRWLIIAISAFLYGAGYKVITFTAIQSVYNAFKRMGLEPISIAQARHEALPGSLKTQWSKSYYDNKPNVYIGDIVKGTHNLLESIRKRQPTLLPLWEIAYSQGLKHAENKIESDEHYQRAV